MVRVTYRKFREDNSVIALFPDMLEYRDEYIQSYMQIGQHGPASPKLLFNLAHATFSEYEALHNELQRIGYKELKVV